MKARGKRAARRPWYTNQTHPALKGRNTASIPALQALVLHAPGNQGRRASRLPLAFISRAFGAAFHEYRQVLRAKPPLGDEYFSFKRCNGHIL